MENETRCVGVIGTGNMGRALVKRLIFSGYQVLIGSRQPDDRRKLLNDDVYLNDVEVTSIDQCIERNQIIFVALHMESYQSILVVNTDKFQGKILVDVSNQTKLQQINLSNAEYLSSIVPHAYVIKAFNTVSTFVLENDVAGGSRRVFIAGDNQFARETVSSIARDMGFEPVNIGALRAARKIELYVLSLFPQWKMPLIIAFTVFTLWLLYIIYYNFIDQKNFGWHQIFICVLNKPMCVSAITLLSLTYIPGSLAAIYQIVSGTKYRRFPVLLDRWLLLRKQLGVITFYVALIHSLMSILMMSPSYYKSWFRSTEIIIPQNLTKDLHFSMKTMMTWKGEAASLFGILTIITMSILAVSTAPSIGDTLNWREWRFVQSKLGFLTLVFAVCHVFIMATPHWITRGFVKIFYFFFWIFRLQV
ncbi:unnamed protein product [Didymodactylos carnosus]|uniref:Uncharacterized protein n=2 Tax=Didymodactylos carnosus TaxID=1234261 RepID=A0A813Y0J0_9BILA|nr:unnamed protein product [Didymodactylos carnosus]CAF3661857.1 unnamed protein product [Didymodactylos carnosus]